MGKQLLLTTMALLIALGSAASAADLYRVSVESRLEARALEATGLDAVLRVEGGYLVLAEVEDRELLAESGLSYELVASGVDRGNLALGTHHDGANPGGYPVVYREDAVRLYRVDVGVLETQAAEMGLAALPRKSLRVVYREPVRFDTKKRSPQSMDLETLIALVDQDSLESYTLQLQAFPNRLTGSYGNQLSRDWIQSRLAGYGLDSVYQDSFLYGTTNCQNVIGVKMGTTYPEHRIVVGAHRDAVSGSPGADDNGSGTAGVLEIARILSTLPTEMTWVFALFDAEEQGLHGSYHYAMEAANHGDSIVMMLNMDMIGFNQNTNNVSVYHGSDAVWASRWQAIADSLSTNLTGYLSGSSSGSDHYPFQQQGYNVVFLIEYIFSSVYHSYRDSTSYMSFPYMRRIVQASLATAYDVDATYQPMPGIIFAEIDPVPVMVPPVDTTVFQVSITAGSGGTVAPGSALLHYSFDGLTWYTTTAADMGGGTYDVSLPGPLCGETVQFYLSADEATSGTQYYPDSASPWSAVAATSSVPAFVDNFETDLGWTVSGNAYAGMWVRGVPVQGGTRGDPPSDFDGSGQCFVTGNTTDEDLDNGITYLTSPVFDASGGDDALVQYARWFSNDFGASPYEDYMDVHISNDGGSSWLLAERVGPTGPEVSGGWFEHSFLVSEVTTLSSQMRLRFTVGDLINGSVVEAAVDAVSISAFSCAENYFVIATEDLPDWTAGVPYSIQLESGGGSGEKIWADKHGDLAGTGLTLSSGGLLSGTPSAHGEISFTATCTDEADSTIEKAFALTVNGPVSIVTTSLPGGAMGEAYLATLAAVGGTGGCTWGDPLGGLAGTWLTLGADGVLSGTPPEVDTIVFTARAEDAVGSFDETEFTVIVAPPFVCGDIDNSEGPVNIADLTFFINYLFRGGPEPPITAAADLSLDSTLAVSDLTRLIDYLFRGGAPLVCAY